MCIRDRLLTVGVFRTHYILAKKDKTDQKIYNGFKIEKLTTLAGLVLIVIGYFMEIYFYKLTHLLTCEGVDCAKFFESIISTQ